MVLATHAVRSHACLLFPHSACEPTTRSPGTLGRYNWSSSRAKRREGRNPQAVIGTLSETSPRSSFAASIPQSPAPRLSHSLTCCT